MKTRLFMAIAMVCLMAGGVARAADFAQAIVTELQEQGYARIETESTWLGRVRIVAERSNGTREIILNPRTGEILRDLWLLADGTSGQDRGSGILDRSSDDDEDGSSGSGSGSDDSDSDDSGSSGSGSSGSGSGGSDDP